jgi:rubrerythrin
MMASMDFLEATTALGQDDELDQAAMELLVKVENSGEGFYGAIADRLGNDEAAVLLRRNGREEIGHARRVTRAMALKYGVEPSSDAFEPFPVTLPDDLDARILPYVLDGELQGDAGYQGWADREDNPAVAKLLRQNGREEIRHANRVREVMAILGVEPKA